VNRWLALALAVVLALPSYARAEDLLPPQIIHEPCDYYQKGQPFTVRAQFFDDSALFDPKVVYRNAKGGDWRTVAFRKGDDIDFVAVIKVKDLRGPLEYFIETFDENGNGPARYGTPEAPVRVLPSDDAPDCQQTGEPQMQMRTFETEPNTPVPPTKPPDATTPPTGTGTATSSGTNTTASPQTGAAATPSSTTGSSSSGTGTNALTTQPPPPAASGCDLPDLATAE
jgi:hypothetical protein